MNAHPFPEWKVIMNLTLIILPAQTILEWDLTTYHGEFAKMKVINFCILHNNKDLELKSF